MYNEMTDALLKIARGYYIILDAYLKARNIEIFGNKESLFFDHRPRGAWAIARQRGNNNEVEGADRSVVEAICEIEHYARDAKNGKPDGLRITISERAELTMKCQSWLTHKDEVNRNDE